MNIAASLISLEPGLYLIRHPGTGLPPFSLTRAPTALGRLQVLSTQANGDMVLRDPSDCVVVHVMESRVDFMVAAYGVPSAAVPLPPLRVDRVALADPRVSPQVIPPITVERDGLLLIGHVEGRGDVIAAPGKPLGEQNSMRRLEGFQIDWIGRPEGVDLAYSVQVEGAEPLPVVTTGHFTGTRQNARRINGVAMVLVGPRAEEFRLEGKAFFSGGFAVPIGNQARGQMLGGPSGAEHLVGLQLDVLPTQEKPGKALKTKRISTDTSIKAPTSAPAKDNRAETIISRPKSSSSGRKNK